MNENEISLNIDLQVTVSIGDIEVRYDNVAAQVTQNQQMIDNIQRKYEAREQTLRENRRIQREQDAEQQAGVALIHEKYPWLKNGRN